MDPISTLEKLDFSGNFWCCRRDSNSRPLPYQGSALPLSYGSTEAWAGIYKLRERVQADSGEKIRKFGHLRLGRVDLTGRLA